MEGMRRASMPSNFPGEVAWSSAQQCIFREGSDGLALRSALPAVPISVHGVGRILAAGWSTILTGPTVFPISNDDRSNLKQ